MFASNSYGLQMVLIFGSMIIAMVSQMLVTNSFNKYSKVRNTKGLTGSQIAQNILDKNGYTDVRIQKGQGMLSDYFDPKNKIVNLSPAVHDGNSIAAAAIAAHECGHVMQYKKNYGGIALRNKVLPLAMVASNLSWGIIMAGLIFSWFGLLYIGIGLLAVVMLFQILTLPVEFNASSRALDTLVTSDYITIDQQPQAKKLLSAAAFTYVAAVLASLMQIARLLLIANSRNN